MNHSFDIDTAVKYGVEAAVFIENMRFWIAKNKANKKHFYDDRYWTYNSTKAFSELFPYWSQSQVQRIIKKLEDEGFLLSGNYNQNPYDRTKWYSLNEEIHLAKSSNENDAIVKSTNRTDINTNTSTRFAEFWDLYPNRRKGAKGKCEELWTKRGFDDIAEQIFSHVRFMTESDDWTKDNGQYIKAPLAYLNGKAWDGWEPSEQNKPFSIFDIAK